MFEKEYKDLFDKIHAPDKLLSRVLIGEAEAKRTRSPLVCVILLSVLVSLLVACSAVLFDPGNMLEAAFGENGRVEYEEEELRYREPVGNIVGRIVLPGKRYELDPQISSKYLTPYIFEINESISDGKTTLVIKAGLYDTLSSAGILYLTLENPNGFEDVHIWSNGEISWLNDNNEDISYLDTSAVNRFYVVEEEREDTSMGMICPFAHLKDKESIEIFYTETGESISIPLPLEQAMERISFAEGTVTLTPISLVLDQERFEHMRLIKKPILTIQFRDGTEKTVLWHDPYKKKSPFDRTPTGKPVWNYYLMTGYPVGSPEVNPGYLLNFVVDLQNVESITLNDEILMPD